MILKPTLVKDRDLYFKAIIYGEPGVGKTRWVAENCPNPVWIDFERSTDTLKKIGMNNIPVVDSGEHSIVQIHQFVMKQAEKPEYDTLVFDTISSAQTTQLAEHMIDKFGKSEAKRLLPLYQDFRVSTQLFNEMFLALQHSKMHVVLIAHERENYVGEGETKRLVSIGPSVTPALQDSARQLVNAVLRYQKVTKMGNVTRSMLCANKKLYLAKNRYNVPDEIENPTWDSFMEG